jgi:spermidine synthase
MLVAYALSGCAALIYEVCWTRLLAQQIGQSVWAVATVLAAFMGGLAGGALVGGALTSRLTSSQGLRAYAGLEAAIAACALTIPIAIAGVTPMLAFAYTDDGGGAFFVVMRLAAVLVLVGLPAAAMGATYPAATLALAGRADRPASGATALYVSNTAGACVGAAAAGFLLIPRLGLSRTSWLAAALNLLAGAIALRLAATRVEIRIAEAPTSLPSRRLPADRIRRGRTALGGTTSASASPPTAHAAAIGTAALIATGFVALAQEVAWTRVLALTIGPTTYAFSTMLTLFILGLALGSSLASRIAVRVRQPFLALGVTIMIAGVAAIAAVPAVRGVQLRVAELVRDPAAGFATVLRAEIWMFAWLLLPLAAAFGAAFPFALRLAVGDVETAPRKAALLYGANTVGAIAGSLATGFLLIPRLGLQRTIEGSGLLATAAGVAVIAAGPGRRAITAAAVGAFGILGVVVVNGAGWDAALLSAGAYKYASYVRGPDLESALGAGTLLYYRDGAAGTVSVRRLAGALTLAIDGKVDASNAGDMQTQKLLAHLPLMLHARPRRVAIIGLGSGVTLGAALRHPVERATTIEISREVIDAAGFFEADNGRALADRRATVIASDGRSHLLLATTPYDVIISEPSNPWMAGVASLFTREFFLAARHALAPDGILCQWAHTYDISSGDLRSIVATFASVFPDGTMWMVGQGDVLLIGSPGGIVARLPGIEASFTRPGVAADLADVGVMDAAALLSMYAAGPDGMRTYAGAAIVQTDDRGSLEFSAPRAIVGSEDDNASVLRAIASGAHLPPAVSSARVPADPGQWRDRGGMYLKAEAYALAYDALERAVSMDPEDQTGVDALVSAASGSRREDEAVAFLETKAPGNSPRVAVRIGLSRLLASGGDAQGALGQLARSFEAYPDDPRAFEQAAAILADAGDVEHLRALADRIERRWPERASAPYFMATAALLEGRLDEAERLARQGIRDHPNDSRLHTVLGASSAGLHRTDPARAAFERALTLAPRDPTSYTNLGLFELETGAPESAIRRFAEALVLDPSSPAARRGLAQALRQTGHEDRAARVEHSGRDAGQPR